MLSSVAWFNYYSHAISANVNLIIVNYLSLLAEEPLCHSGTGGSP